jgi:histidinol phosphatase-like enzyme (inositol monophosphatase family)
MSRPPTAADLPAVLEFAVEAARRAGRIVMSHYNTGVAVEAKSDNSPVTVADREAEKELRRLISERFPADGILGEEYGETPGTSGRRWILDPVDGTRSFIHGIPLFGVLIGVEDRGRAVAGVCLAPAMDEMVYAARGLGATWLPAGGKPARPARVSEVSDLSQAMVLCTTVKGLDKTGRYPGFERLREAAANDRGWGDCYGHLMVATGRAEVMLDPVMNIWDCAALLPILLEAGGTFSDWRGDFTHTGGDAISTNGKLYERTLKLLQVP